MCRMHLRRSSQVKGMKVSDIAAVIEKITGYVTLYHQKLGEYEGLPVVSHKILQAIRDDQGGWGVLVIQYPGSLSTHAIIVSGSSYRDNTKKGRWRPITDLRGAKLVDMFAMGKPEDWTEELKAQETEA